jgi:hypothetical protein
VREPPPAEQRENEHRDGDLDLGAHEQYSDQRPMRKSGKRSQRSEPPLASAALAIQSLAQHLERAMQARLHRAHRHVQSARDLARRKILEVAQEDRAAVRLVERADFFRQDCVRFELLEQLVLRRARLGSSSALLARLAPSRVAPTLAREIAHDGREPARERSARARSSFERRVQRVLRDIFGVVRIGHEPSSESMRPSRALDQLVEIRRSRSGHVPHRRTNRDGAERGRTASNARISRAVELRGKKGAEEHVGLFAKSVRLLRPPVDHGTMVTAVLDDACGNLPLSVGR